MKNFVICTLLACGFGLCAEIFTLIPDQKGIPAGWAVYHNSKPRGLAPNGSLKLENGVLHIKDLGKNSEYGIRRTYKFEPGKYVFKVDVSGQCTNALMVVFDGKKTFSKSFKTGADPKKWTPYSLGFSAAGGPGYIFVYGNYAGTADFSIKNIAIEQLK